MRLLLLVLLVAGWCRPEAAMSAEEAAVVYQQKCASCHGADGQGVSGVYETALHGARSVSELARLIERTMPEGEAHECVGEEAAQVADYVFHEFYSPVARVRKGLDPAISVELSRLTISQYRNAVADVIGHFSPLTEATRISSDSLITSVETASTTDANPHLKIQPGFKSYYYGSKGMSKAEHLAHTGIDDRIDFDFGQKAPYEAMPEDQFAIVWDGALFVPDSGEYSLRVTTPNGARVYLNLDPEKGLHKLRDDSAAAGQAPLIDAWVGSGQLREESARIELLGGRRYPIRIEFFKYQESAASIRLEWKPPHGVWAVLDDRNVMTAEVGRTYITHTALPADDRSAGFERGASITPQWYAAIANGAVEAAEEVVSRLPLLSGTVENSSDEERKLRVQEFIINFARIAFRRPLDQQEIDQLKEIPFRDQATLEDAANRAITWILCSPEFLLIDRTPAGQPPSQHAVACRLAFCLWDSIPDAELLRAAETGQLNSLQQVETQARRMLNDLRTRYKLSGFFRHWLHLEERDLTKDKELFPDFDQSIFADLKYSLELLLEKVVWSPTSDYRQLLVSQEYWLNAPLGELYGLTQQAQQTDAPFDASARHVYSPFVIQNRQMAGVLTHPYLLSALAYHNNTSPIHRGVFVARNVLGRALRAPPVATAFENDEFPPDLTMRQKVSHLTQDASCLSCHTIINPLGFALENFDAVGRWRDRENDSPIDAASDYETEDGEVVQLSSPRDIAELAIRSKAAHRAFVLQMFQHFTKQSPAAYGPEVLAELVERFEEDQFHIQNLMIRIAVLSARYGWQDKIDFQ